MRQKAPNSGSLRPQHPTTPLRSAASFLKSAARSFLEDRDPASKVDEAIASWQEAREAEHAQREGGRP